MAQLLDEIIINDQQMQKPVINARPSVGTRPGLNQSGALTALAQGFAMPSAVSQVNTALRQPRTVNIGGMEVLNTTPISGEERGGLYLQALATDFLRMQEMQNKKKFLKNVQDVMKSNSTVEDKMNNLYSLKMQYGDDYGLGVDNIIKQYSDSIGKEWKPRTMNEAIAFEEARSSTKNKMSPSLENAKNKRIENVINVIQDSSIKRDALRNAIESSKRIQGGIYGKIGRNWLTSLNPGNPALQDWQNIKIVLTDAQLMNTAKTKGAISDKEMGLFASAAANDDVTSIYRMMPVFNKLMNSIDTEERNAVNSYRKLYGEDPYTWDIGKSNIGSVTPEMINAIPQEFNGNNTGKQSNNFDYLWE